MLSTGSKSCGGCNNNVFVFFLSVAVVDVARGFVVNIDASGGVNDDTTSEEDEADGRCCVVVGRKMSIFHTTKPKTIILAMVDVVVPILPPKRFLLLAELTLDAAVADAVAWLEDAILLSSLVEQI